MFKSVLKTLIKGVAIVSVCSFIGCSEVPAGNVGIKVYLLGSDKGVDSEKLGVGRYVVGWNEKIYTFPTYTQNYVWTQSNTEGSPNDESISFQTIEGMSVNTDVGISYTIRPEKIVDIFQKYRKQIEEITDIYLRNMVRDAFVSIASKRKVEDVYGAGKAQMLADVEKYVRDQCGDMFDIERIYLVGDLRLPPEVTEALNGKIRATQQAQRVENEVQSARAEAQKKIAEAEGKAQSILIEAKSQAEANKILSASLTPEFVQYQALQKWNGALPSTMVPNASVPFVNVK